MIVFEECYFLSEPGMQFCMYPRPNLRKLYLFGSNNNCNFPLLDVAEKAAGMEALKAPVKLLHLAGEIWVQSIPYKDRLLF